MNLQRGDKVTAIPENIINKSTARIGFIGLGLMGSRLTRRLHSSGWNVQAWNRSPDPAKSLARDGVVISSSIAKLVADSDVILSSLANDEAVHSVYFDNGGVFSSAKPGTVILEMSTISPELSRLLHQEASVRSIDLTRSGYLRFNASGRGRDYHTTRWRRPEYLQEMYLHLRIHC
jgi:hypothetical protein